MAESHDKTHITETPDVSYVKNIDVTREVSDVYVPGIVKFVIALSVLMVASFFLMWVLFRSFNSKTSEPRPSPMALTEKDRLPPEPRLQGAPGFAEKLETPQARTPAESATAGGRLQPPKEPLFEMRALREQWNDTLEHGPVDQNGKRFGMPIEEAKKKLIEQGLPARKQ